MQGGAEISPWAQSRWIPENPVVRLGSHSCSIIALGLVTEILLDWVERSAASRGIAKRNTLQHPHWTAQESRTSASAAQFLLPQSSPA